MNPWSPGSFFWVWPSRLYPDGARPVRSLDDGVALYLESLDCEIDRIPEVLRISLYVDDCDHRCGEPVDCRREQEHYLREYATAFVPIRRWLDRMGWGNDAELLAAIVHADSARATTSRAGLRMPRLHNGSAEPPLLRQD
jgi:hypothetical protein